MGWGRLEEAAADLERSADPIRRQLVALTVTALVAGACTLAISFIRSC
jgi:hypothetical protein